jgi:N-hydroxyarylamine O-acetyltransferase
MSLDLDAYLARVAWRGELAPTFDVLARLLRAHMDAVPFENLDPLLGREVRLDLEGLQAKLVGARRGGYCFEHVTLLRAVLERAGFAPVAHAARVTLIHPRAEAPRTHMFLTVPVGGRTYVLDPGFGVLAPRVPVPLEDGALVTFGHEAHRMVKGDDHWMLRAKRGDEWVDSWVTTFDCDYPIDFELANYWTWSNPRSAFTSRLMMRVLTPDGRVTVSNRDATVIRDGVSETRQLADRAELRAFVARHFGFDLPEIERLRLASDPEWG